VIHCGGGAGILNLSSRFNFVVAGAFTVFLWILQVRLGKNGVEEVLGLGELSDFEKEGLENLKAELKSSIEKGIKFAHAS
jgi:malate/lactate dehydrogenase